MSGAPMGDDERAWWQQRLEGERGGRALTVMCALALGLASLAALAYIVGKVWRGECLP